MMSMITIFSKLLRNAIQILSALRNPKIFSFSIPQDFLIGNSWISSANHFYQNLMALVELRKYFSIIPYIGPLM